MWSSRRARLAALAATVLGGTVLGGTVLGWGTLAGAAPLSPGAHKPAILLENQSQWVVAPASSAPTAPSLFDLTLRARNASAGAQVDAVLYPRLNTRYDFKNTVANGPRGIPISSTSPTAVTSLPPEPRAPGSASFAIDVVKGAASAGSARLGLACAPPTGSGTCTGVYPVVVQLLESQRVVDHFTTFLTYVAGKSAHPLDFAWVVPFSTTAALSSHPSGPSTVIAPLSKAHAAALDVLAAQLRAAAGIPLTLDASPQTLQRLAHSGAAGRAAITTIATLSQNQAVDQVLAAPYVPINLGALAAAGEPTEIVAQMAAGATVMHKFRIQTARSPAAWVTTGPVGSGFAAGLKQIGATQVVVPGADLAPTVTPVAGTWASTFQLALGKGTSATVRAAETDTLLDGQFSGARGDPALAASQLLADLAMVHFERPNTTSVRGMIAVPPAHWMPNATFDRVLLAGLQGNPDVAAVTLSGFFGAVTPDGTRHLQDGSSGPRIRASMARAISTARVRLSDFDSAVVGAPPVLGELDDALLSSESENLSPRAQASGIRTFERVLSGQLHLVTFATQRTFTLTARTGWIPVTVESRASYTVIGTLSVSGNKFVFPHRSSRPGMRLTHVTNPWRVLVKARSSGDLPLRAVFTSPNGRLVIAQGVLTVRSTATSVVGVVLTVLALGVLLTWWGRTWWTGRRRRRRLRAAGPTPIHPAQGPVPARRPLP